MTKAYELGKEEALIHSSYTRTSRNAKLVAAGYDLAHDGGAAAQEFRRGFDEGSRGRDAHKREKLIAELGPGPYWRVTAEHCGGASVGHPCTTGVYSDPTDSFSEVVAAATEEEAIDKGQAMLAALVDGWEPCACKRHEKPGWDRWWNSVTMSAAEINV